MARRLIRRVLLGAAVFALTLLACEAVVRLSGYAERHLYDPIYMRFERSPEIAYVHKPNLVDARARGFSRIDTDSLGLRSTTPGLRHGAKAPNEYRIAIAGDSGVFGEGVVRTEDTFPQVLEDALNRRQSDVQVRVFNFAASGYSVKEMAATLEYRMLDVDPDLVIMVLIDDDFVLSRTPALDAKGYLVDRRFSGVAGGTEEIIRRGLRSLHLAYLVRSIAEQLSRPRRETLKSIRQGELPPTYDYVRRFGDVAERAGKRPLVVLRPATLPQQVAGVLRQIRSDGIPFLDLSGLRDEFSDEEFRASRFDTHPSAAVHARIGEVLAEWILERELPAKVAHGR